jgi:DNA polymerase (family 10)
LERRCPVLDNNALAALLFEASDLLAIVGGDPHRARAFWRAGQALERLPEPTAPMLMLCARSR